VCTDNLEENESNPCSVVKKPPFQNSLHKNYFMFLKKKYFLYCMSLLIIPVLFFSLFFYWIYSYSTPLEKGDLILVGNLGSELEAAADLYHKELVKSILITKGVLDKYKNAKELKTLNVLIQERLQERGVSEKHIFSLPRRPLSMFELQSMLREFILTHNIKSYIQFSPVQKSRYYKILHDDTFPEGDVKFILYLSKGSLAFRKEILSIHNVVIRLLYWKMLYKTRLETMPYSIQKQINQRQAM
jgi:hypothetical protein